MRRGAPAEPLSFRVLRETGMSRLNIVRLLALAGAVCICASSATAQQGKQTSPPDGAIDKVEIWQAPTGSQQINIWPGAVPDGTFRPQPAETVRTYHDVAATGGKSQVVMNIAVPTMTIISPKEPRTKTAVIVFPGGGFQKVFVGMEGTELCDWLTAKGVTCIVSKYRAPGGNDFYDAEKDRQITPKIPRALQDAQRTIRLVRSKAAELGIDPHRIGVLGMSAGGYLVAQTSNILAPTYRPVDAIDGISSRPDFAIALYPGHICRDHGAFDPKLPVSKAAPPQFIVQTWDDEIDPVCNSLMYASALNKAGVPTELHLFARGGHAFALRHPNDPVGKWPELVELWLRQINML